MSKQRNRIILLALLVAAIVLLWHSPLGVLFTFENLKQHRDSLSLSVQGHYWLSVVCFIALYVLITSLSLPGAAVLTLAGGFLFGMLAGTLYVNVGATTGASFAFLSARYLLGKGLQEKYQSQLRKFNSEIERSGTSYLLTLRFIPVFPFFSLIFSQDSQRYRSGHLSGLRPLASSRVLSCMPLLDNRSVHSTRCPRYCLKGLSPPLLCSRFLLWFQPWRTASKRQIIRNLNQGRGGRAYGH